MKKSFFVFFVTCMISHQAKLQTILSADGEGQTYELINSVLAPDGDVIETPDCSHEDFGRHITEQFDDELDKFVFNFVLHVDEDDDRCINFDRQRNEIKTYGNSPDHLLGVLEERVIYTWKFQLEEDFQPSSAFTHLHQLKAVGGSEDAMPLITLTARKGSPDNLELRYAESLTQVTLVKFPLSEFRGRWVEVVEEVVYGDDLDGQYEVNITAIDNGESLFSYSSDAIRMWKTNASFIRPKWGIYRSLNDSQNLKDESVLYADFTIEEVNTNPLSVANEQTVSIPTVIEDALHFDVQTLSRYSLAEIYTLGGRLVKQKKLDEYVDVSSLSKGLYILILRGDRQGEERVKFLKSK